MGSKVLTGGGADRSIAAMKLGSVALVLAAVSLASATARAESPRMAVADVSGAKAAPELRDRMTHAIREGLSAAGVQVVADEPAAQAAYVVRGALEVVGRTYELRLELADGKTGAPLDSREDRCEICTEGEALEMAGVSASALKSQVFKKLAAATAPPAAAPEAAPPVIEAPPPAAKPSHRGYGWIGVGVAAAAAVVGGWLIVIDGDADCSSSQVATCMYVHRTKTGGIATLAGGALALTAGILVLSGTF
jgi:hypothetical protein